MQKFVGSLFFVWDEELRCPASGERAVCNSSDLNEELGQVRHLVHISKASRFGELTSPSPTRCSTSSPTRRAR